VDDSGKLYRQRRHATQGKEFIDPKANAEGSSESSRESPPPCPKGDQPQPPPMGEESQPEHEIGELCTLDVDDILILNFEDIKRPFKIKVSTIYMVQH
jgi:hypothetical protein